MDGLRHGHGSMAWQDGTIYQGEWKFGQVVYPEIYFHISSKSDFPVSSLMDLGWSTIPAERYIWGNSRTICATAWENMSQVTV